MTRIILALFCALVFAACSSGSGKGPSQGVLPRVDGRDTTNRSLCNGEAPKPGAIFGPGWEATHQLADGTEVMTKMYFFPDSVTVYKFCSKHGVSTYAQATATAVVNEIGFHILNGDTKHAEALQKGVFVQCDSRIEVTDGMVPYSFQGNCLSLNAGGESLLLLPR